MNENEVQPTRLRVAGAARYLGLGVNTLNKMRAEGRGPRYLKLGNRVFYRQQDLDAYVEGNIVETVDTRAA